MAITNSAMSPNQPSPGQPAQLQLHDIHLPEQVSNFPIAPGWWLLLALMVLILVWSYKKFKQNKRLNCSKKEALAALENNPSMNAKECITLLKWAAMKYVNRQQLAKLYSDSFQDFLIRQLPEKHQVNFIKLSTPAFKAQYQAAQADITTTDIDSDCQQATKLWLTHALPITDPPVMPIATDKEKELSA